MRRLSALLALAVVLVVALSSHASEPRPGTLALGAKAADPEGGAEWAVRTWHPRAGKGSRFPRRTRIVCLQAGRLAGGRLVRTFASGRERVLEIDDRTTCFGTAGLSREILPAAIERLADDPASPRRLVRTLVAGIAPDEADRVVLAVRGAEQDVPIDAATHSFLAVLDGSVRRADLALRVHAGGRIVEFDFGQGTSGNSLSGAVRRGPEVADPLGGPPFGSLRYAVRSEEQPCLEAGRVIGDEVGAYDATWGSFLDAPTLAHMPPYEDAWAPAGAPLGESGDCGDPERDDVSLRIQRFDDRVAVFQGLAGPDVRALELRGPDGSPYPVALAGEAFVGATPSSGKLNERAALVMTLANGRRRVRRVALGPQDVPTRWDSYTVRRGGRVLRIHWGSGVTPFSGADVKLGRRTATVTIFERFAPTFSDDGWGIFYPQPLLTKCADVVLPRPLGGRRVIAGRPGGAVRRSRPGEPFVANDGCPRMRAGTRLPDAG